MTWSSWLKKMDDLATPRCARCNRKVRNSVKCKLCKRVMCSENCFERHVRSHHPEELTGLKAGRRNDLESRVGGLGVIGLLIGGVLLCGSSKVAGTIVLLVGCGLIAWAIRIRQVAQKKTSPTEVPVVIEVTSRIARPNPPPLPSSVADEVGKLKALMDQGALSREEFEAQKKRLLG